MRTLFAIVFSLILTTTAHAAPVTFAFTGIINQAPISGSYTFESTAPINDSFFAYTNRVMLFGIATMFSPPPLSQAPRITANTAMLSATVNWDGQTGSLDMTHPLAYEPRYGASGVSAYGDLYAATVHVAGLHGYNYFGFTIDGLHSPYPYDRTSLPTMPPSLNGDPAPSARLELFNRETGAFVQGQLTSLTAVPIPPSVWLFGAGILVLLGLRWRQLMA